MPTAERLSLFFSRSTDAGGGHHSFLFFLTKGGGVVFAIEHGVGQFLKDNFDRANAVVVAGNGQIDFIGVAIGIDQR